MKEKNKVGELKLPNFKTYYNATVTNAMRETSVQPLGLGRSPREGKGYPLQYSGLENSMDSIVHGVAKSWKLLKDFHMVIKTVWSWGKVRQIDHWNRVRHDL